MTHAWSTVLLGLRGEVVEKFVPVVTMTPQPEPGDSQEDRLLKATPEHLATERVSLTHVGFREENRLLILHSVMPLCAHWYCGSSSPFRVACDGLHEVQLAARLFNSKSFRSIDSGDTV